MARSRERITETMSGSDALLWTIGGDPVLRPTVIAVLALDRAPCWSDVRNRIEALTEIAPRFRSQGVSRAPGRGRPQFREDPRFDLDLHLRRIVLPAGGSFRDVLDIAQVMATSGFDAELPPWEAVVVEGVDSDRAALIVKLHHALVDGVGGIAMLAHLLDTRRHPRGGQAPGLVAPRQRPARNLLGQFPTPRQVLAQARRATADPAAQIDRLVSTGTALARLLAPARRPISTLMTGRSSRRRFEAFELESGALRRAAAAAGSTLNDVFVAAVVRGLGHYHELHGHAPGDLRALMPLNVRGDDDPLGGNHFVPARFVIPASADAEACLRVVGRITASWKHSPGLALSDVLATGLNLLPAPVLRAMWGSMLKGDDFCVTNVPGAPFETYLAGSRVDSFYAFAPPSGAALNVSLVTPAGRACIGLVVDTSAVPDSAELAACLREGFADVFRLTSGPTGTSGKQSPERVPSSASSATDPAPVPTSRGSQTIGSIRRPR
jgi:diacylglycerol O-acyltransferase / wax synthase